MHNIPEKTKKAIVKLTAESADIEIFSMWLFQVFINVGMTLGIMPVTGIPLPFMSYGGSALVMNLLCVGILMNIYLRRKKLMFD